MIIRKIQALAAIFVLLLSTAVLAQDAPAALTAEQVAILENATDLEAAAEALLAAGVSPASLATALSERGQTPAQITTTLVTAITATNPGADVATVAAAATTAVRTAVPTATNAQLQAGLVAANVSVAAAQTAVAAAPVGQAPADTAGTTTTAEVGAITSAGLLVGLDGRAVVVQNEEQQVRMVYAFVQRTLQENPAAAQDETFVNSISKVLGSAVASSAGVANATSVSASVSQSFTDAITALNISGNTSTLALLVSDLISTTIVEAEDAFDFVTENPAQDDASPS